MPERAFIPTLPVSIRVITTLDKWQSHLRKLLRFASIYGPRRTAFKASGRLRVSLPAVRRPRADSDVAIVGCGQYAYATIGYFLARNRGHRLAACFDIDRHAAESLGRALRVRAICSSFEELLDTPNVRTVYIASNHASHAAYALRVLERGMRAYIEKPIAVERRDLVALMRAARQLPEGTLHAGYNRPFSGAIRWVRERIEVAPSEGFTLSCFVAGHRLSKDHWYHRQEEGTRICGNVGHWIDLFLHIASWRGLPDELQVTLSWSNPTDRDDNLTLTITSDRGDLFSVTLTSRSEPFEGIRETIHLQHGDALVEINDFRKVTLWAGARLARKTFWPKDVGHERAIMQPFESGRHRPWREIELSAMLILHIAGMVREGVRTSSLSLTDGYRELVLEAERDLGLRLG